MEWWIWLALGLLLLVVELATPGGFFVMFFGLGAITVGALTGLRVIGAPWLEWLLFTLLSVGYILAFRRRLQERMRVQTRTVDSLVGDLAVPRERILPGAVGRVELRGSQWQAKNDSSTSVETGQRCRVVRVDGLLLGIQPE
jgi:inner membrane protein